MKLYLVQHGEALSKDVDPERPLSDTGRIDVAAVAGHLTQQGVRVAHVLHSGKARAKQTAEILARSLAPEAAPEFMSGLSPKDPVAPVAEIVNAWSEDSLIAGHLPFMAKLVARLITGDETRVLTDYRPGSVVCLEKPANGDWIIAWMLRPDLLTRR